MRESVILLADLHINSTLGLCMPGVVRDDGDRYDLSAIQLWLWHTWEKCLDKIKEITTSYRRNIVLVGDLTDLDIKGRSTQLVTMNPSTVLRVTADILDPVAKMADCFFVVRGTEAHSGKSGWSEEEVARDLGAVKDPSTGDSAWWQLRADFGGIRFDIAHHASMGQLPWTYGNSAMKLAITTMNEYADWGEPAPHVVARAHAHRFADSGLTYPTRAFFLPAWQWSTTSYLHRLGKSNARPHIGALVFLIEDGSYVVHDLRFKPKREPIWKKLSATSG